MARLQERINEEKKSMPWQYSQSTGQLTHNGQLVSTGYSGAGVGQDNTAMEATPSVGPIPRGAYTIGSPHQGINTGPHVMDLTPSGHNALGRTSFQIHGDNSTHTASSGCIVMGPAVRTQISNSGDNVLNVVD